MIIALVAGEVAFWLFVLGGLTARYLLRARTLGLALLIASALVDVALLGIAVVDLRRGGDPRLTHGLAAIYLAVSIVFGHQMIRWADERFAHRFAGGPAPARPPRDGKAHAAHERRQWWRHLLAYAVAAALLGLFALLVGDPHRVQPLWSPMRPWGLAVVIDFLISFSYTLKPRTPKPQNDDALTP